MNTDKAYLMGLVIGGGIFGEAEDKFVVRLPYKKWGTYASNPDRAIKIEKDIHNVGNMFRTVYGICVEHSGTASGIWTMLCEGDVASLKEDFAHYGIACEGELRKNEDLDIGPLITDLSDDNLKKRFIAGLADTIGSMASSHRRFTQEYQIVSFEINGFNFKFVCDLCRLLYSVNCMADQVLWNHPNIHVSHDPYYTQWKKGFKLRVLMDQYANFGALCFRAKAEASEKNRRSQRSEHKAEKCETRGLGVTPSCVHPAENDRHLPENIRGGHYIHFRHICAVMGCGHAPYCEIEEEFKRIGELVNPFPICHKDDYDNIQNIIDADSLLSGRIYDAQIVEVRTLLDYYSTGSKMLLYGKSPKSGYPISKVLDGVAYVLADKKDLHGKRTKGNFIDFLEAKVREIPDISVELRVPDLLTPLIIVGNDKGVMIGANNPDVYEQLVTVSSANKYKLIVRKITEEDLQNV